MIQTITRFLNVEKCGVLRRGSIGRVSLKQQINQFIRVFLDQKQDGT